jgi:two-component system, chemotaxis family, protein-glutamate methylesterase/glutaminase
MPDARRIRVLVAEDSATVRALLVSLLESDPAIEVVGEAATGAEAIERTLALGPDVITMDIHMPVMAGLEATKEIMVRRPTPIIIVSSSASRADSAPSFDALRAGALLVLPKPDDPRTPAFNGRRAQFLAMVKAMADVRVVRRRAGRSADSPAAGSRAVPASPAAALADPPARRGPTRLIAVATSTGGPAALQRILQDLPRDFPVPMLVVQHIAPGFVHAFADWLASACDLHVRVAAEGEPIRPRTVYLAPDDHHLGLAEPGVIRLDAGPPIGGLRPSATHLFREAARHYGSGVTALVLTGMGADGIAGLRDVRAADGRVLAQDERSSVIYGMPREAREAGLVDAVLPLDEIGHALVQLHREALA